MSETIKKSLRVLIVEDSEFDAVMLLSHLRKGGYDPKYLRVDKAEAMKAALKDQIWDIVPVRFFHARIQHARGVAASSE